jgi:hypothetical protein
MAAQASTVTTTAVLSFDASNLFGSVDVSAGQAIRGGGGGGALGTHEGGSVAAALIARGIAGPAVDGRRIAGGGGRVLLFASGGGGAMLPASGGGGAMLPASGGGGGGGGASVVDPEEDENAARYMAAYLATHAESEAQSRRDAPLLDEYVRAEAKSGYFDNMDAVYTVARFRMDVCRGDKAAGFKRWSQLPDADTLKENIALNRKWSQVCVYACNALSQKGNSLMKERAKWNLHLDTVRLAALECGKYSDPFFLDALEVIGEHVWIAPYSNANRQKYIWDTVSLLSRYMQHIIDAPAKLQLAEASHRQAATVLAFVDEQVRADTESQYGIRAHGSGANPALDAAHTAALTTIAARRVEPAAAVEKAAAAVAVARAGLNGGSVCDELVRALLLF